MEALGSPSISRAPMGGDHAFRKLVYAGNRHNDIHYRSLLEIHFTPSGFFLKTFDRLCVFVFVSFFLFFFFFFESTHYEKRKKKQHKNNNLDDLQTGRTNTLIVSKVFRLSREKSVQSMCYQNIYIKVYLTHKTNHA